MGYPIVLQRLLAVAALAGLSAASVPAAAEWSGFFEYERFRWTEPSIGVKEKGPLKALGLTWDQDRDAGIAYGYRGKYYWGDVDYDGSTLIGNTPVQGNVEYRGFLQELQATYRRRDSAWRAVFGVGLNYWNRQLTEFQREEWWVYFVRLGAEWSQRHRDGWSLAGGLKYPFYVYENTHASSIGFDEDTKLYPEGRLSPYADLGYRMGPLRISAFYDSWRFDRSATERASGPTCVAGTGASPCGLYQPASNADMYGLRLHIYF